MVEKLTDEEISIMKYFLLEKGDVERWIGWENAKPKFEAEYPELLNALRQVVIAKRTLLAVVNSIECEIY